MGMLTPIGIFFLTMRLMVPGFYVYIFLILLREISDSCPSFQSIITTYLPTLSYIIAKLQESSILVEIWVVIEALFYIAQKLHIRYLQYKDPLEASLASAPILTIEARNQLLERILELISGDDPVSFIRGWFFDEKLEDISRYDICDFITWCMFEGRNQEHLTRKEGDGTDRHWPWGCRIWY